MRRKNNKISYSIETRMPSGVIKNHEEINTLQDVCDVINHFYFNDFQVVSRAMVNMWVFGKDTPRRPFAKRFSIKKVETIGTTTTYPIST